MPRILVLAPEAPPAEGVMAAGPGLRAAGIASTARDAGLEVTLAGPAMAPGVDVTWHGAEIRSLVRGYDAVIVPQSLADLGADLARRAPRDLPIVVDCYAPAIVERLGLEPFDARFPSYLRRVVELLRRGDLFLTANAQQRVFVLGQLAATGRLNPSTITAPPIVHAPFGVPDDPPTVPARRVARGVLVDEHAPLAVWFGGIYPWFDAATALRGFARALEHVPAARLAIVGGRDPRGHAASDGLEAALSLASALGVADRVLDCPWVPFAERVAWYAEADCAICLARPGVENDLSNRTRLLDLVWGRVPIVGTAGDAVAERVAAAGAGLVVAPGDDAATSEALVSLLGDQARREACRAAAVGLADELSWSRSLAELNGWLADPRLAADRFGSVPWRVALGDLARSARSR